MAFPASTTPVMLRSSIDKADQKSPPSALWPRCCMYPGVKRVVASPIIPMMARNHRLSGSYTRERGASAKNRGRISTTSPGPAATEARAVSRHPAAQSAPAIRLRDLGAIRPAKMAASHRIIAAFPQDTADPGMDMVGSGIGRVPPAQSLPARAVFLYFLIL